MKQDVPYINDVIKQCDGNYEKAVKQLVKEQYCSSTAEARRLVKYVKIQNGDKKVRH